MREINNQNSSKFKAESQRNASPPQICLLGNLSLDPTTQRNDACSPSNGSFGVALPDAWHRLDSMRYDQ